MWSAIEIDRWIGSRRSSFAETRDAARAIVERVRTDGDAALIELVRRFDGVELRALAAIDDEREAAYEVFDGRVTEALVEAEARITAFHESPAPPRPLALGGRARDHTRGEDHAARSDRCVCHGRPGGLSLDRPDVHRAGQGRGRPLHLLLFASADPPLTLVVLDIAGVTEIYRVGGAQANAAMTLGKESIAPVQKVVGPGNIFVTAAKQLLQDQVEIDFPVGPSEVTIVADATARPEFTAADVLTQSEHDPPAADDPGND